MDSLKSPQFKSKVEQFYYENSIEPLNASEEEVEGRLLSTKERLRLYEARKRAYSGDGRKSYFTFDKSDLTKYHERKTDD